jgi:hypothetical protein
MKYSFLIFSILLFFACNNPIGDKKSGIDSVNEIGNTSFVNKKFSGNIINYNSDLNPCQTLGKDALAKLYQVSSEEVHVIEGNKSNQVCTYRVLFGGNESNLLIGSIAIRPDNPDNEVGTWEERWSIQKVTSKSSEYLPNMGKAALWKGSKRTLSIKFEGYTLEIYAPGSAINVKEKKKNRDYKSIAIGMAKAAGFLK